jgi:hypothetical protein
MNHFFPKIAWISILAASVGFLHPTTLSAQNAQIQRVAIHQVNGSTEIEIQTSRRVVPLTQIVTDPARLVIDFPDAVPGPQLRSLPGDHGDVKGVRAGLFSANPPTTRVVLELKSTQDFKLVPSSKAVIIKIAGTGNAIAAATPSEPAPVPAAPAAPEPATAATPVVTSNPSSTTATLAPARMSARPPAPATASLPAPVPVLRSRPKPVPELSLSPAPQSGQIAQVRRVSLLKVGGAIEIEIEASQRIVPAVQVVTGPDRLVLDFSESTPGPQARAFAVNQGEVKGVRIGLLSSRPPVTRVVLDLKSPQAYQLFPLGKSVIVKLGGPVGVAQTPQSTPEVAAEPAAAPPPEKKVTIEFRDGLLSINSDKATLAEVLNAIHEQTGADIPIPAGAEQEVVAASLGPAAPRDVVAKLLDGSHYNYIILGADNDINKLERVILSPKSAGNMSADSQPIAPQPVPVAAMQPEVRSVPPDTPPPPPPPDDPQPQGDSIPPDTAPQPGDPPAPPN